MMPALINNHIAILPIVFLIAMFIGNLLNFIATFLPHHLTENNCLNTRKFLQCCNCTTEFPFLITLPFLRTLYFKEHCPICKNYFGLRYPVLESLTAATSMLIVFYIGFSWVLLCYLLLAWGFILLIAIDHEHYLLPDIITLSLVWLGLLVNSFQLITPLQQAVWGASIGYMSFLFISWSFKQLRGIEGLGRGDCKLFAALGAWWGIQALLPILLIASLAGSAVGLIKMFYCRQPLESHIPFGPYLILGAVLVHLI